MTHKINSGYQNRNEHPVDPCGGRALFRDSPSSPFITPVPQTSNMAKVFQIQILEEYRKSSESVLHGLHCHPYTIVSR